MLFYFGDSWINGDGVAKTKAKKAIEIVLINKSKKTTYAMLDKGRDGEGYDDWFRIIPGDCEVWKRPPQSIGMRLIISASASATTTLSTVNVSVGDELGFEGTWTGKELRHKTTDPTA